MGRFEHSGEKLRPMNDDTNLCIPSGAGLGRAGNYDETRAERSAALDYFSIARPL